MGDIANFKFNTHEIRVVTIESEPWFVAMDVRAVLGIQQGGSNYYGLDATEHRTIRKSGSTTFKGHGLSVISESGLYKFVLRSDKPQAKPFQDWVTKEVLPAIRKDGMYVKGEEKVRTGELSEDGVMQSDCTSISRHLKPYKTGRGLSRDNRLPITCKDYGG